MPYLDKEFLDYLHKRYGRQIDDLPVNLIDEIDDLVGFLLYHNRCKS